MDSSTWLAFVVASSALLIIPGPTVLLVLSYALSQGRRVALATVAGVALGDLIAMTVSLAGLGAVLIASATLFTLLKWVGAAYLVYLGVKLVRRASGVQLEWGENPASVSSCRICGHAAAVTALNPKSIVFFIAFVPQFVSSSQPVLPQFLILTATFVSLAMLNALAYAMLADRLRRKITKPTVLPLLSRVGGGALILMGAFTLTLRRGSS